MEFDIGLPVVDGQPRVGIKHPYIGITLTSVSSDHGAEKLYALHEFSQARPSDIHCPGVVCTD